MTPDQLTALAARLRDHAAMHESIVPNDDEQRQWRDDLIDAAEYLRQCAQADAVEALRELVALKDMKERLRSLHERGYGTDYEDYYRLKPLAWGRARAMLAAVPQPPSAQDDAIEALRMALDALACTGESHDPGHRCTHCDDYVDRNAVVRARIRAVLAAQGGDVTDLELMELAAKAAGIAVHRGSAWHSDMLFREIPRPSSQLVANVEWNPLNDDGDALRLAVKCGILNLDDALFYGDHAIYFQDDPCAATRRAIVRAAAEIGRRTGVNDAE